MADQKSRSHAQKNAAKKQAGKKTAGKKNNRKAQENKPAIPARLLTSVICLGLFVLFLMMAMFPEGVVILALRNFIQGLIGQLSFYIAIPALLYLFVIQAFSGKRPVRLRSYCLIAFVVICGSFYQLVRDPESLPSGAAVLTELFAGGYEGKTAGLICGGIGLILNWCLGKFSFVVLGIAGLLTLLAAFQITIPSIIRAVQNRPRPDWEDEEPEEVQEPAAVVVNHLATKRIEHLEQRRKLQAQRQQEAQETTEEPAAKSRTKADDFMSQIDGDVEKPVAAAEQAVSEDVEVDLILSPGKKSGNVTAMEPVPEQMPLYEKEEQSQEAPQPPVRETVTAKDAMESAAQVAAEIAQAEAQERPQYSIPPIELLKHPGRGAADGTMEMRENTRRLNETLSSFKIEAHIVNVTRGPSVTRYEVELEKGVKLSKLTNCADDIALSLGASGVRIAAVPGKISVVGVEVPNRAVTTVSLREVIDSNEFNRAASKSSFAVGKDISGNCIVGNIAKLPHMLIAGTTGSGKSVCMNSIIISLLYKAGPEDVKLIMVDPKMVELGIYNGIPHLLIPVVTDPKKAAGSLQWAVSEMMRRYKAMSDAGVRDLESYNSIVEAEDEGTKLPQVVVIIDELADLMLVAAKEVEESICRIAQMGRAAGIHLIIATQRPSADVITGLMKANIPSRIAFAVASAMESRIILDTQGAEKLVGRGDMLYAPIGAGKPLRVQGCFVSDPEVEAVTTYVKENFNTTYDQQVMEEIERKAAQAGSGKVATVSDPEPSEAEMDGDELLPAAVDVILETGQASVSMLQRRLKLGYARAARIVDEMEEKGIVGPFQGSKPRSILMTKEQWESMRSGAPAQMGFADLDNGPVPEDF